MIPEIRITPATAIGLTVAALAAMGIAVLGAGKLETAFDSETGAFAVLVAWCLLGAAAAITGIVDAFVRPEGERLDVATRVAGTAFAVLSLVVLTGMIVGATGAVDVSA